MPMVYADRISKRISQRRQLKKWQDRRKWMFCLIPWGCTHQSSSVQGQELPSMTFNMTHISRVWGCLPGSAVACVMNSSSQLTLQRHAHWETSEAFWKAPTGCQIICELTLLLFQVSTQGDMAPSQPFLRAPSCSFMLFLLPPRVWATPWAGWPWRSRLWEGCFKV